VYLAYLDDSDTKSKAHLWQVMSAVMVKDSDFRLLEIMMGVIIEDLVPADKLDKFAEFHACELYGGYGVFEGIDQPKRFHAIESLLGLLQHDDFPVIYGAVDLVRLKNKVYASADPIDIVFRICADGVEQWMVRSLERLFQKASAPHADEVERHAMALFIVDVCDGKTKTSMQRSFREMRKPLRPPAFESGRLRHVHDDMYFGDSKFSVGIQLADLCSYFIARHLDGDISVGGFYKLIEPHIVYSKVEPNDDEVPQGIRISGLRVGARDFEELERTHAEQRRSEFPPNDADPSKGSI
jgi:Protein of unknown function (DUF3800)